MHSPFVFDLITAVVRESADYYAFQSLEDGIRRSARERKMDQLLFRLSEHLSYRRVLLLGEGRVSPARYLAAVSTRLQLWSMPHFPDISQPVGNPGEFSFESLDMVFLGSGCSRYWNASWEHFLAERTHQPFCLWIMDIHRDKVNRAIWDSFRGKGTVSLDMMWFGLLFFDSRLQAGSYFLLP